MRDYNTELTPERMTELGAEMIAIGDNGPLTGPEHRMRYEKWSLKYGYQEIIIFYDHHCKLWHIQRVEAIPFRFEHTFRDILKLMNITLPDK